MKKFRRLGCPQNGLLSRVFNRSSVSSFPSQQAASTFVLWPNGTSANENCVVALSLSETQPGDRLSRLHAMAPYSKDLLNVSDPPTESPFSSAESAAFRPKYTRPQPLSLEVPVGVQGSRRVSLVPGQPDRLEQFSEETRTVIVFPHGAVVRLSAVVTPGQMVVVTNRRTHQAVLCKVTNLKSNSNVKGYVEVEFVQPMSGFWGVYFPQDAAQPSSATQSPLLPTGESRKMPTPETTAPPSLTPATDKRVAPTASAAPGDFWGASFPAEALSTPPPPAPHAPVAPAVPIVPPASAESAIGPSE